MGGRVAELEKRLQAARLNPEYVAASTQLAELRAEQESLNAKLAEKGSYVRDAREVEREMARMREALAPAPRRVSSPGIPAGAGRGRAGRLHPRADDAAADLMAMDVPTLAGRIGERCAQYLERADRPARGGRWTSPTRSGPRARAGSRCRWGR